MEFIEIILRLGAATLAGCVIGLNRDLRGKPTGVRTLGVVALASALIVMAANDFAANEDSDWAATSRVIQGLITGIGFLGAGVIIRNNTAETRVHGLTTAACIWLTACMGVVCAIGAWHGLIVALVLVLIVLVFGGPFERAVHRLFGEKPER
jgi:putative Mg2+ transporter-C (MgtC) family protein